MLSALAAVAEQDAASRDKISIATLSGIDGEVAVWPSCAAEPNEGKCGPQPVAIAVTAYNPLGIRIGLVNTDRQGRFRLNLPPDSYRILVQVEGMQCESTHTIVRAQDRVHIIIRCD